MRKLLLLLGIICIFVLNGCGKSDGIEGTWIPKIHSDNMRIESIQFTKQNDFSYKGVVTYSDGKQVTSTFKYDKQYNEVAEEPADALKKKRNLKFMVVYSCNLMKNTQKQLLIMIQDQKIFL